jgi:RNA polymerase sigma-70 factor (ECF subfamily)
VPPTERSLVRRAVRDPDAFAALYRLHYPAIARYVRRRVGDAHAADDLIAETFTVAFEQLPRYRQRGLPFRAWLYRLASTRVSRWVRRQRLRAVVGLDIEPAAAVSDTEDAAAAVRAALLGLPPRYQTVLALHYLEGLSIVEIGVVFGCRPGTIKARLHRGRERLRRRLHVFVEEFGR